MAVGLGGEARLLGPEIRIMDINEDITRLQSNAQQNSPSVQVLEKISIFISLATMSTPSFIELEAAACAVIEILKTIPEFCNAKIAIIGGLSLWKYLQGYRTTEVCLSWPLCQNETC